MNLKNLVIGQTVKVDDYYITIAEMREICEVCADAMIMMGIPSMPLEDVLGMMEIKASVTAKKHMAGPKALDKYYEKCMSKGDKSKEYCARVAWSIYCQHVNPSYEGCTKYGKTKLTKGPKAS